MISVVIPTLNAESRLPDAFASLVPGLVAGMVREVIVVDGGSSDHTREIAEAAGAKVLTSEPGRGRQLRAGGAAAKGPWVLFLHADTVLEPGWYREAESFIERVDRSDRPKAAAFRFGLDDFGAMPRFMETMVGLRCLVFRMPYGDQGLLMPLTLYRTLGGYRELPLMEDVDIVRRLGRGRLVMLRARAVTSAERYRRDGYAVRVARNLTCVLLYYLGVPVRAIARIYG